MSALQKSVTSLLVLCGALSLAGCQQYLAREELMEPYSGDAVARNVILQMRDPWPVYVYNTNIPTSGARQSAAIKRYSAGPQPAPTAPSPSGASTETATSTNE